MAQLISQLADGLLLGALYALMALGLTTMFGVMRITNFAYGVLFMLGAYVGYVIERNFHQTFVVALVVSMAVMFIIGMVIEVGLFNWLRKSEERTILAGLGLMLLGEGLIVMGFGSANKLLNSGINGSVNFSGGAIANDQIFASGLAVVLLIGAAVVVKKTPAGRMMRSVADDPNRASLLGISQRWVYMFTFGAATALSAGAACLLATWWQVSPTMDSPALLLGFVIVIIGGMGSMVGSIIAGLGIGVIFTLFQTYVSQSFAPAVPYLLLLVLLIVRPQGILGKKQRSA